MRKAGLLVAFIVLATSVSTLFAFQAENLVVVTDPAPSTARQLVEKGMMVVRDMERYLLVVATTDDLEKLSNLGLNWEVLDESIEGKIYYTVGIGERVKVEKVASLGRLLRFDGLEAVVEATPEEAQEIAALGLDIAKVFMRPIRFATEEKPFPKGFALEQDLEIQAMVDSVSGSRIDACVQRLQDFVTRYASHDSCQAAANWIKAQFESFGIDSVFFHHFSSTYKDNVVAVLPGAANPDKIVVIGAHYDSYTSNPDYCPGADDNASGTACVLECARILSQYEFNYTIKLIAFGAEEMGLIGSEAYASDAASRGDDITGMVNVDMIGYLASGDVLDLDVVDNASSQWMRDLAFEVASVYVPELSLVDGSLPAGASSDHASFWANGYDAIMFFEDSDSYSPYIHTSDDVVGLSYNSPTLAERSVKVAVGLVATMAEPFRIAISHTPLGNTEDTENPYPVVARIVAAEPLNPDSLIVYYSAGGAWTALTMAPTGNPDEYEALIPAQPGGTWVDYYIVAQDSAGNTARDPKGAPAEAHRFFVGTVTPIVMHDFESDQGWTVGDVDDNATTGIWERCDPEGTEAQPEDDNTPDPGTKAYITQCAAGTGQGSYDVDGGKTTLFSPIFDLSGYPNAWVRYYRWYSNDTGASPETDRWIVDISDDGGSTWVRLETLGSSDRTWRFVERNLLDYIDLTSQVQFRFVASDSEPGSIVEAGLDDFSIVVYEDVSGISSHESPAAKLWLSETSPNPFGSAVTVEFSASPGARVSLTVHDVLGRVVKTLLKERVSSGSHVITWDATNDRGAQVAAGLYIVRLESTGRAVTRKIVLTR